MAAENDEPVAVAIPAPTDPSPRIKAPRLPGRQPSKDWNQMNDLVLLNSVQEHEGKWQLVSNAVGRDAIECAERFRTLQSLGLRSPASVTEHHRIHRKPSTPVNSLPQTNPRSGSSTGGTSNTNTNSNKPRPSPHVLNTSQTVVNDPQSYIDKENVSHSATVSDTQPKTDRTPPNASLSILSPQSRTNHQNQRTISPAIPLSSPNISSAHKYTQQRPRAPQLRKPPSNPSLTTAEPISNLFHTDVPSFDPTFTAGAPPSKLVSQQVPAQTTIPSQKPTRTKSTGTKTTKPRKASTSKTSKPRTKKTQTGTPPESTTMPGPSIPPTPIPRPTTTSVTPPTIHGIDERIIGTLTAGSISASLSITESMPIITESTNQTSIPQPMEEIAEVKELFGTSEDFLFSDADLANLVGGGQVEVDSGFPDFVIDEREGFMDVVGVDQSIRDSHPETYTPTIPSLLQADTASFLHTQSQSQLVTAPPLPTPSQSTYNHDPLSLLTSDIDFPLPLPTADPTLTTDVDFSDALATADDALAWLLSSPVRTYQYNDGADLTSTVQFSEVEGLEQRGDIEEVEGVPQPSSGDEGVFVVPDKPRRRGKGRRRDDGVGVGAGMEAEEGEGGGSDDGEESAADFVFDQNLSRYEIDSLFKECGESSESEEMQSLVQTGGVPAWYADAEDGFSVEQIDRLQKQLNSNMQLLIQAYTVQKVLCGDEAPETEHWKRQL
ncbi:hypothetical protein HK097_000687, partial [Rhizophlyctis rosea]